MGLSGEMSSLLGRKCHIVFTALTALDDSPRTVSLRRLVVCAISASFLVASCSSANDDGAPTAIDSVDCHSDIEHERCNADCNLRVPDRESESTPSVDAIDRELRGAGIRVVPGLSTPVEAYGIVTEHEIAMLSVEQAEGGGVLGSDIDEVTPQPADSPPFSYVIAGWIAGGLTERSRLVASWYPSDIDWTTAPQQLFSRATLLLFTVDIAEDTAATGASLDRDARSNDRHARRDADHSGFRTGRTRPGRHRA